MNRMAADPRRGRPDRTWPGFRTGLELTLAVPVLLPNAHVRRFGPVLCPRRYGWLGCAHPLLVWIGAYRLSPTLGERIEGPCPWNQLCRTG
jgi:hypothetical protein